MIKFNHIYQLDSMQCGVACIAMICKFYGCKYTTETLEKYCTPSSEGVSIKALSDVASLIGFRTIVGKVSLSQIKTCTMPCILHWNQKHFVVLYKISKNGKYFYIADPAKGKIKYSLLDFEKYWISTQSNGEEKGIAMFFEPTLNFGNIKNNNSKEKRTFSFLFGYLKQYRNLFFQIILGLLLSCALQLIMPFLTQSIVDIGISNSDLGFIWLVLLGELMIIMGQTATSIIRNWLLLHISMHINISLVSDFFIKLLKLPMAYFETKLTGDLLQRMSDHNRIQNFLTSQFITILFATLSCVVFGCVLLLYNPSICFVFIIGSIIHCGWFVLFLQKRKVIDYELFEKQAKNQNKTLQFITSIQEIKLQDCEQRRRWEWEDIQADLFIVQMKSLKLQQIHESGRIFIGELKNIFITVFAASAVINGQITLGMMLAVQYVIGQLNYPINQLMNFIYTIQDVKISLERINEIHLSDNEETNNNKIKSFENNQDIIFDNVNFKYDPHSSKKTIDNISLNIPSGKVTAIVGASGSGKTTLIKLILGYYKVVNGNIFIAGENINSYNLKWWRQQCGVVMQDGIIFSESIARNIAINDDEIDIIKLEQAASIANIHNFIMSLPLKYNTIIGKDGVGLSQGQKQRILIARAVYKNPNFIFLDEATNALDAENEKIIVENLSKFYKGKTVIVVAHRLSTVKNANQIIVLNNGKIVEIGNHNSLIKNKGTYYNLVKNQLELGH